jgi:hypothetical protein
VSRRISIDDVIAMLGGDHDLYEELVAGGYCHPAPEGLTTEEVEAARVAQILLRDLEVNWPGVEVALALRQQVFAMRRQVAELIEMLRLTRL